MAVCTIRDAFLSFAAAGLLFMPLSAKAQIEAFQASDGTQVKVETLATGLNHPWGMAFLPDGRLLVSERNSGDLHILNTDNALSAPIAGTPETVTAGQGGLMDVALDPDFAQNRYVYLSYAEAAEDGKSRTALGRGRLENDRIADFEIIFRQDPAIAGSKHFGNRIAFSPNGQYLFFAMGERFQFDPAQDLSDHLGTIIRIYPNGRIPEDNPFAGQDGAKAKIWSYGHRNIEAMDFQPATEALWVVEMGPKDGDELNLIEKGANYGWQVVSWGDNYDGSPIPDPPSYPRFADAEKYWTPVISPSGMVFYEGEMFPQWRGSALVGGLSSQAVIRIMFDGTKVTGEERFPLKTRIRDVEEAPDGSVYLLTDQDSGKILRLSPM